MLGSELLSGLKNVGTFALASALGFASMAQGAILTTGSALNISGAEIVSATTLDYQCNLPGDTGCNAPPAGDGDFAVASSSGSFAPYFGTFGLIEDLDNATAPLNQVFSLPTWIAFDLNDQITLELTFRPLGTDPISPDCAGLAHCTPTNSLLITPSNPGGLSGFNLDQTMTGTNVSYLVQGIAHASDGTTSTYSGSFTVTFGGLTPAQTLATMLSGAQHSYSGNITLTGEAPAVPEPASLALVGVALGALGFSRRRRKASLQ